jgi:hypothetical protein
MRPLAIVGILLLVAGLFIGFQGASYRSEQSVLRVGEFEATVEQRRTVPPWVGWTAALVGLGLVVASFRSRPGS